MKEWYIYQRTSEERTRKQEHITKPQHSRNHSIHEANQTMKPQIVHSWPGRYSDIRKIQREILAPEIDLYGSPPERGLVLGIECVFREPSQRIYCAAVLMRYPGFTEIERSLLIGKAPFPPNPEISSFREGRTIVEALEQIQAHPDLLMIHGEGVNSVSGIGIATHMGIIYDIPSVGCSRRRLMSIPKPRVGRPKNSVAKVVREGKEIGIALRSRAGVKSIYISPGYRLGMSESLQFVRHMLRGFRTPEPIRVAHLLATRLRSQTERQERDNQKTGRGAKQITLAKR